jgi:integrative and conjugative element protein (TIGR02256 family)
MQNLIFRNGIDGEIVIIERGVVERCAAFRFDRNEAGGILIGNRRGVHFELIHATQPMIHDTRSRARFIRADPKHNQILTSLWQKSGRSLNYLGDWHTHPEDHPSPSSIDLREWTILGAKLQLPLVFIIFGRLSTEAWLIGNGKTVQLLKVL